MPAGFTQTIKNFEQLLQSVRLGLCEINSASFAVCQLCEVHMYVLAFEVLPHIACICVSIVTQLLLAFPTVNFVFVSP
jgi:hypothetical protein